MKSTKIEDIIERVDEDISEDVADSQNDDVVNNELKMQLDNLQTELLNMKQGEYVTSVPHSIQVPKSTITTTVDNTVPTMSVMNKLLSFNNDDLKNALIMIVLFIILNSTQVNEMIDMYIPYSIYTYGYIVKAILYFCIYRVIVTLISS